MVGSLGYRSSLQHILRLEVHKPVPVFEHRMVDLVDALWPVGGRRSPEIAHLRPVDRLGHLTRSLRRRMS